MEQSLEAVAPATQHRARPPVRTRVTWWVFVVALGIHAGMAVAQPFLAGAYLNGDVDLILVHGIIGDSLMFSCLLLLLPAAILLWRPGRGPIWPWLVTIPLFLAEGMQVGFGWSRQMGLHIPLGVAIIGTVVAFLVWSVTWRVRLGRRYRGGGVR